ncbi:MAG: hypothetical protein OXI77_16645 [Chloroflexota bacterium]|nr:hypothetical protein [Chloroflexota bacterium]MDE2907716.1 hypothetical protein [Chloroflexota bacterium]
MAMTDTDALTFESRLSTLEERSKSNATKEDLAGLKADLRTDMYKMKADLIKWFIGTQIALAALIIYLLQ